MNIRIPTPALASTRFSYAFSIVQFFVVSRKIELFNSHAWSRQSPSLEPFWGVEYRGSTKAF
jgi:hypothetical protein